VEKEIESRVRGPQHVSFLHVLGWRRDGTVFTRVLLDYPRSAGRREPIRISAPTG